MQQQEQQQVYFNPWLHGGWGGSWAGGYQLWHSSGQAADWYSGQLYPQHWHSGDQGSAPQPSGAFVGWAAPAWSGGSSSRGGGRGRGRNKKADRALDPRLLTSNITSSDSLQQLESLESQPGDAFNDTRALATAFCQVNKILSRQGPGHTGGGNGSCGDASGLLRRLWQRLEPQLDRCDCRGLSNVLWACSKLDFAEPALLDGCLRRLAAAADMAIPQELANAVYGAARLDGRGSCVADVKLVQQIVAALVEKRHATKPQELSNTLWAAAKLGQPLPEDHVQQLVAALVDKRQQADPQAIANALSAVAKLGQPLPEGQVQHLVAALVDKRQVAETQHLSNTLWAAAKLGQPLPEDHVQQLVASLVEKRHAAKPQQLSNTLWAAAKLGQPLPEDHVQQLVAALVEKQHAAKLQDVANTLWAVAKMGQPQREDQVQRLVARVVKKQHTARPHELSNTLWAVASLGHQLPEDQVQQLVVALVENRHAATLQQLVNTLWACAEMRLCLPALLDQLSALILQQTAGADPQNVSNAAYSLAKLGCSSPEIFSGLVEAMQEASLKRIVPQDISNMCWAVAVADQRQCAAQVLQLCHRLVVDPELWEAMGEEEFCQLYQLHLWLCDWQAPIDDGGAGLAGALSQAQLQCCAQAWYAALGYVSGKHITDISHFQREVFACACRLPSILHHCCHEASCYPDGAFSIDVAAIHRPTGLHLAIEADGPFHFLDPDHRLAGKTLARNRALAARGYVVVSVPWWEWGTVWGLAAEEERYLAAAVEAAVAAADGFGGALPHPGG